MPFSYLVWDWRCRMIGLTEKMKLYPSCRTSPKNSIRLHIIFKKSSVMYNFSAEKSTPLVFIWKQWGCSCIHRSYAFWSTQTITKWGSRCWMFSPEWKLSRKRSIMLLFAAHASLSDVMMTVLLGIEAWANTSSSFISLCKLLGIWWQPNFLGWVSLEHPEYNSYLLPNVTFTYTLVETYSSSNQVQRLTTYCKFWILCSSMNYTQLGEGWLDLLGRCAAAQ